MSEKRNTTKEDVLLKTRLLAEGVQYEVKGPLLWESTDKFVDVTVVFNDCDIVAETRANPRSRLTVRIDGNDVAISEMGEVLGTATLQPRAPWRGTPMGDGTKVDDATMGMNSVSYILTFNRCFAWDSGRPCRFCAAGQPMGQGEPLRSLNGIFEAAERSIEATVIAIENGLRYVLIIGGAAPPDRRGQWTTDLFEAIMTRFREALDDDLLSQVRFMPSLYPPEDLGQLHKWKGLGITAAEFDSQVMDPAYFKAICPARGDQMHWFEAQEAAAEVFGRGRGSVANVVTGIEPMAGLLEGIEERMSKGVWSMPLIFFSAEGAAMEGMRPASRPWYEELWDKITDIYLRYADTTDVDLTKDNRWGYTRTAQSIFFTPFKNVWISRLQELGKLPPGLPNQYGIDVA